MRSRSLLRRHSSKWGQCRGTSQQSTSLVSPCTGKGFTLQPGEVYFAESSVEYLGHTLSRGGIAKGSKVDTVPRMPPTTNIAALRSFLGSLQYYGKFIPQLSTLIEPFTRLTKKNTAWRWGYEEQAAIQRLKDFLCTDTVLVHFDSTQQIGNSL